MLRLGVGRALRSFCHSPLMVESWWSHSPLMVESCCSTAVKPLPPSLQPGHLRPCSSAAGQGEDSPPAQLQVAAEPPQPPVVNNLSSLMELANKDHLHFSTAHSILVNLAQLKREGKVSEADYTTQPGFLRLLAALEEQKVQKMEVMGAIACIKVMAELEVGMDHIAVKSLETTLTWASRNCPIQDLVMMLSFCIGRRQTENQKILFSEVCKALERRWVEIKGASALVVQAAPDNFWVLLNKNHFNHLVSESGKDSKRPLLLTDITDGKVFCGLLHYSEQFSPQFLAKLEDRLGDLVEEFPPSDLAAILKALAMKRRRNIPLLKALAFYLTRHREVLDVKQLADSLFSLNQLSFKDPVTLDRLCAELEGRVQGVEKPAVLRSVVVSLGQLRFLSPSLMDAVCDWYEARQEGMEDRDRSTLLVTLANLNYRPPRHTVFLKSLADQLEPDNFRQLARYELIWLDLVWSLVALDLASDSHLESVLNQTFLSQLLYSSDNRSLSSTLKLLNINAAASRIYTEYKGPVLNISEDALLRDIRLSPGLPKLQFCQTVLEAFSSIAQPPKYMNLNLNTQLGCQVEGELVCDAKGSPLLVEHYSTHFGALEPKQSLPEGANRVAVVAASFQDCLISGAESGVTALNCRLLEASGYKVVLVRHSQLEQGMTLVARVKLMESLLHSSLGLPSPWSSSSPPSSSPSPSSLS